MIAPAEAFADSFPERVKAMFGEDGLMAKAKNFEYRPEQQEMAVAVARAPLLQAATRGHLSVSFLLIEKGADVNAASNDGWTPLHKAAANGHVPEVKLLLSKGADVKAKYRDGTTA